MAIAQHVTVVRRISDSGICLRSMLIDRIAHYTTLLIKHCQKQYLRLAVRAPAANIPRKRFPLSVIAGEGFEGMRCTDFAP